MIRAHNKNDMEEIIRLYTLEYKAMPYEIESLRNASTIFVYEENGIQGFIRLDIFGNFCYAEIGISRDELIKSVGIKLWEKAKEVFKENSVKFIQVFHVKDNDNYKQLFDKIGFHYWYSVCRFSYEGNKFDVTNLKVINYEDKYFDEKFKLESEAFSDLRKENDIRPYNWYDGASKDALEGMRKTTLKEKAFNYLFFDGEDLVGGSKVKDGEIELLFVSKSYQGKGYGKKLLKYTINKGLEQNPKVVTLNSLASNNKALSLYRSVGFRDVQSQDCRRLYINE